MSNTYNALIHAKQDGTSEEVANNLSGGGGSDASPEVEAMLNVYGSKNLIPYPYEQTTKTENGITFTDNGNGTVTVNGTATDTTIFTMHSSNSFILNNGTYTMDGCPNGGSTNSYYHVIQYTNSDNQSIYIYDTGDGTEFTLNGSYGRPDDASILQGIVIIAGTTVNNITFKPMIRDARIKDSTWVPFAMTNRQLTESVEDLNSNKLDLDNITDFSGYTSFANSYIVPKDGIIRIGINSVASNHCAAGFSEGVTVIDAYGTASGTTVFSFPVKKGQGICAVTNTGTGNTFHYYPFK